MARANFTAGWRPAPGATTYPSSAATSPRPTGSTTSLTLLGRAASKRINHPDWITRRRLDLCHRHHRRQPAKASVSSIQTRLSGRRRGCNAPARCEGHDGRERRTREGPAHAHSPRSRRTLTQSQCPGARGVMRCRPPAASEDCELVFALAGRSDRTAFERAWRRAFPHTRLSRLGRFVQPGALRTGSLNLDDYRGYEHLPLSCAAESTAKSAAETQAFLAELAAALPPGHDASRCTAAISAVGKTTFVQGLARGFGIIEPVTSPTFNIYDASRAGRRSLHASSISTPTGLTGRNRSRTCCSRISSSHRGAWLWSGRRKFPAGCRPGRCTSTSASRRTSGTRWNCARDPVVARVSSPRNSGT